MDAPTRESVCESRTETAAAVEECAGEQRNATNGRRTTETGRREPARPTDRGNLRCRGRTEAHLRAKVAFFVDGLDRHGLRPRRYGEVLDRSRRPGRRDRVWAAAAELHDVRRHLPGVPIVTGCGERRGQLTR